MYVNEYSNTGSYITKITAENWEEELIDLPQLPAGHPWWARRCKRSRSYLTVLWRRPTSMGKPPIWNTAHHYQPVFFLFFHYYTRQHTGHFVFLLPFSIDSVEVDALTRSMNQKPHGAAHLTKERSPVLLYSSRYCSSARQGQGYLEGFLYYFAV